MSNYVRTEITSSSVIAGEIIEENEILEAPYSRKLPEGTVDELLKPENKDKLATILQHHVYVGVYKTEMFQDGMILGMVDGTNAKISKKGDDIFIDKAKIIATVPASNGVVYVIDEVILPQ